MGLRWVSSGVGKLSLVDGRRTVASDVDRKCVWSEHHSKLQHTQCFLIGERALRICLLV